MGNTVGAASSGSFIDAKIRWLDYPRRHRAHTSISCIPICARGCFHHCFGLKGHTTDTTQSETNPVESEVGLSWSFSFSFSCLC